jgi:O-antigen/teichoic acid export membrane protein
VRLKRALAANYASHIYGALAGVAVSPFYLAYMGVEAYGLIGLFTLLQSLFLMLDLGATQTLTREVARQGGTKSDSLYLWRLLHLMESVFALFCLAAGLAVGIHADWIAGTWLKAEQLDSGQVQTAIELMAAISALRLMSALYRAVIGGLERHLWLGGFNSLITTARFLLVFPVFIFVGSTPAHFFVYQLVLAAIELAGLALQTYRWLPAAASAGRPPAAGTPIEGVFRFSLSIAFTSTVWAAIVNLDRLVLSGVLTLSDYAYFSLAVLAAGAVTLVTAPMGSVLLPRLTALAASGDERALFRLYGRATQLVTLFALPAALVLACFAEQVLWVWTGDTEVVRHAAPVLQLYALGNGMLALGAFPYYLQYAKGDVRLHLIGNVLFLVTLAPALLWSTWTYGALGAGWTWLGTSLLYLLLWVPVVHRRFRRDLHRQWLRRDVGGIALASIAAALLADRVIAWPTARGLVAVGLLVVGAVLVAAAAAGSPWIRETARRRWRERMRRQ